MNGQMSLPNAQDFATLNGAAAMLGVVPNTVKRYVKAGTLDAFWPIGADQRVTRDMLLSTAQLRQLAAARKLVGRASA